MRHPMAGRDVEQCFHDALAGSALQSHRDPVQLEPGFGIRARKAIQLPRRFARTQLQPLRFDPLFAPSFWPSWGASLLVFDGEFFRVPGRLAAESVEQVFRVEGNSSDNGFRASSQSAHQAGVEPIPGHLPLLLGAAIFKIQNVIDEQKIHSGSEHSSVNPEALNARIFADRLPTHLDRAIRPFWPWPKSRKYGFQLLVLLDVATDAPQQLGGLAVGVRDERNAKARISPQSPKHIGNAQNLRLARLQKTPETEPIVRLKQFDPLLVMQTQSDRL